MCHHLVNDVNAVFSKTMNVCFACAKVATFDCVVEQTMNAVAVTLVVLCTVDTALGSNGVRTTCRVMKCKRIDLVSEFGKCCCS